MKDSGIITKQKEKQTVKLTIKDWELFPDDHNIHEIIEGEHYMSPPPLTKHQKIIINIIYLFETYLRGKNIGEIFSAPIGVVFSETSVVEPDIVYISKEKSRIINEDYIRGVPDLIIEILSPYNRRYDLIIKKHLYEKFGVNEYWVVDLDDDSVTVYKLKEGRYDRGERFMEDDIITTTLLEGLKISLKDIFRYSGC